MSLSHTLNILGSTVASTLRLWRGTMGLRSMTQPAQLPVLFDRENCDSCRLVREALTELNLDVMVYPIPEGGTRYSGMLRDLSGQHSVPFLHDPNTRHLLQDADAIITYLFGRYGRGRIPIALRASEVNRLLSRLASCARGERGKVAMGGKEAALPLVLYSFESSPFSRPVRERLCELELAYQLVNLSKQQAADLGPAKQRLHLGKYKPLEGSKREAFLNQHGRVQVPYLVDPNTGTSMFESERILAYLDKTYA